MKLEFDFMKVIQFTNPVQGSAFERLKRSLMTLMVKQKDNLFRNEVDPSGTPWKPLQQLTKNQRTSSKKSEAQLAKSNAESDSKFEQHKILQDSRALMKSLTSTALVNGGVRSTSANEIILGTNLPYAAIQNFGSNSVLGQRTRISDKKVLSQRRMGIPARPFIGFGEADNKQVQEKIAAVVAKETKVAAK